MRDDFLSDGWAVRHHAWSHGIHKLAHRAAIAFRRLHAYQYDAPWRRTQHG